MSGSAPLSPVGVGFMRQRHSQGYASSNDDLEDDACSRAPPQSPPLQKTRTWIEIMENVLWIASAVFIIYYGDRHSNFIYLLRHDARIRSMLAWSLRKSSEKWDFSSTSALPFVTLLGIISFCLFSFALWPIWSFLTLPLVFTLFMAGMVLLPYLMLGKLRPQQTNVLRID